MSNFKLAVLIPYYKKDFFDDTLKSLANQTDKRFNVYITDDCSPSSPDDVIDKYKEKINIVYKRYTNNLGRIDLVGHWNRSLELIQDEDWILVLPDDDIVSENVVEEFYKNLNNVDKYNIKVFRFPVVKLDKNGNIINRDLNKQPKIETNIDFYERVVRGKAGASLGDNIFHKRSLLKYGGFVNFPKGWGSDHATILKVSQEGSIYFLYKAKLYFRMSGMNISSNNKDSVIKLGARILFVKWLKENEDIFPSKFSEDFYKFFYWKAEYYILNEWSFNFRQFIELYKLREICFNSKNIIPIIKIFLKKIVKDRGKFFKS